MSMSYFLKTVFKMNVYRQPLKESEYSFKTTKLSTKGWKDKWGSGTVQRTASHCALHALLYCPVMYDKDDEQIIWGKYSLTDKLKHPPGKLKWWLNVENFSAKGHPTCVWTQKLHTIVLCSSVNCMLMRWLTGIVLQKE